MIPYPYIPEQVVDPEDFVGRYGEVEKFKTPFAGFFRIKLIKHVNIIVEN